MNGLFREFDWPNFDDIQAQLVPYVTECVNSMPERYLFNKLSPEQKETMWQTVPGLRESIEEFFGQRILDVKVIYIDENFQRTGTAHVDDEENASDTYYRLNWPILNSDSHETVYFSTMSAPKWIEIPGGTGAFVFEEHKLKRVTEYVLTKPTMMDVMKIHGMYPIKEEFPRIILTIDFENSGSPALEGIAKDTGRNPS